MRTFFIPVLLVWALLATEAAARDQGPAHVRVTLRVIEVPYAQVLKWTGGTPMKGREIHDQAVKLALAGDAEIVETCILICRSGEKSLMESSAEIIYPSVYEPPGSDLMPLKKPDSAGFRYKRAFETSVMSSFETRKTGTTLEIEPSIGGGNRLVDLRVAFDMVDRASLTTWTEFRDQWGDASVRLPVFESKRLSSAIMLAAGEFELWNTFSPKPLAVPAVTTRMMVFVRAEVVPLIEKP
jgi:hypothetical protein